MEGIADEKKEQGEGGEEVEGKSAASIHSYRLPTTCKKFLKLGEVV